MVTHMKTTVEISDDLLARARKTASRERKTLRQLIEEGLRLKLKGGGGDRHFRLQDRSVDGRGVQPGVAEGDWALIRDLAYGLDERGRGR